MKKTIFEEMGGTYIGHGDYLIPCLSVEMLETELFNQNIKCVNS